MIFDIRKACLVTTVLRKRLNTESDPKKEETDSKNEETDQQTENLQLFLKIGNGPKKNGKRIKCKYSGNRPKIFGNP